MLVRKAQKGRHMRVAALLSVLSQVERFSPWVLRWGGWDSNPRPTDYESAALTG